MSHSNSLLPSEIISIIVSHLTDPLDWIRCMATCKSWYEIIKPSFLETLFKVICIRIEFLPPCIQSKYLVGCGTKQGDIKERKKKRIIITNSYLIDRYGIFAYCSKCWHVRGFHLPFLKWKDKKYKLKVNLSELLRHYVLKFPPGDNVVLSQKVQELSSIPEITEITIDYHRQLSIELEQYVSFDVSRINTSIFKDGMNHITENNPISHNLISNLASLVKKNDADKCQLCLKSHRSENESDDESDDES